MCLFFSDSFLLNNVKLLNLAGWLLFNTKILKDEYFLWISGFFLLKEKIRKDDGLVTLLGQCPRTRISSGTGSPVPPSAVCRDNGTHF